LQLVNYPFGFGVQNVHATILEVGNFPLLSNNLGVAEKEVTLWRLVGHGYKYDTSNIFYILLVF